MNDVMKRMNMQHVLLKPSTKSAFIFWLAIYLHIFLVHSKMIKSRSRIYMIHTQDPLVS